jgi:hypothetical protein
MVEAQRQRSEICTQTERVKMQRTNAEDDDDYSSTCSDSDAAPALTRTMYQQAYGASSSITFSAAEQAQNALIIAQSNVEAM